MKPEKVHLWTRAVVLHMPTSTVDREKQHGNRRCDKDQVEEEEEEEEEEV